MLFQKNAEISTGGNYDSRFEVHKASGTLIVARPLDAEQKSNYNLTVEATDGTRTVSTQVIERLIKLLETDEGPVTVMLFLRQMQQSQWKDRFSPPPPFPLHRNVDSCI